MHDQRPRLGQADQGVVNLVAGQILEPLGRLGLLAIETQTSV